MEDATSPSARTASSPPDQSSTRSAGAASAARPRRGCRSVALLLAVGCTLAACGEGTEPPGDGTSTVAQSGDTQSGAPDSAGGPPAAAPANDGQVPRGQALSNASVASLDVAAIDSASAAAGVAADAGPARCTVEIRAIVHRTVGVRGEPATASAALLVPGGAGCAGPFPLLAYARGTATDRDRTLARADDRETGLLVAMFAAHGVAVVATDYLGYARSDYPFHPYLDPATEATTIIDSVRAARALLAARGVALDGRLYLAGYSQGGHATLAAQRAIEGDATIGLAVTASGPMAGPYDLSGSLRNGLVLPSLARSTRDDLSPGDRVALRLGELLADSLGGLAAAGGTLSDALDRLSVTGWAPRAPVLMCHGSRDPLVPFANAQATAADLRARGGTVTLVDVEQVPEFAARLPAAGTPVNELGTYHSRLVPPLCFRVVRDGLLGG